MKQSLALLGLALSLLFTTTACQSTSMHTSPSTTAGVPTAHEAASNASAAQFRIVTTFYPMYDFTKKIVGDLGEVTLLVKPGMEAHDWEPSPADLKSLHEADALVYHGHGMEGWIEEVKASLGEGVKLKWIEATDELELDDHDHDDHDDDHDDDKDDDHDHEDPHTWLSPRLALLEATEICEELSELFPAHRATFERNLATFAKELKALDARYQNELAPAKGQTLLTAHKAFAYLAAELGLHQEGIAGLDPNDEPSPAKMAELIELGKKAQVKTIFFESQISPKLAETLAEALGAQTAVLHPIESLSEAEMAEEDYLSLMTKNLEALKQGLLPK